MHQMENTISIPLIILTLGIYSLTSFGQESSLSSSDFLPESDLDFDRSQTSGLGKRVYGYLSEYKRYPLYNFGLGKRSSHLYNFGLGKRLDEDAEDIGEYDEYSYNDEDDPIPELELYQDDLMQNMDKRQKLYSFGLGKRFHRYDFGLGKRGSVHRYDFGLGKRSQSAPSRDRLYNFGLGKRNRLYSFGLGKRPYNQGPVPGRFNFGLGKRSENFDITRNVISKREIHEDSSSDPADEKSANTSETHNSPAELESHEVMSHLPKSRMTKRSPYGNAFESEKQLLTSKAGFSRQFRKPLYSFGLGKRTPLSNNLVGKNAKTSAN